MRLDRPDSARFALHLGFIAKPTRFPEIEKLPVAGPTVDYVVPLGILFQILKLRRPDCQISENIRSGTLMAFGVRIGRLHRTLVFALQAIPLLLRCFARHVGQSVIMAYAFGNARGLLGF